MIHDSCIQNRFKSPSSAMKWAFEFDEWDLNWSEIYLSSFTLSPSTRLGYLRSFIDNLAVNKLLAGMGIVNSDLCTFCKDETKDIQHNLYIVVKKLLFGGRSRQISLRMHIIFTIYGILY